MVYKGKSQSINGWWLDDDWGYPYDETETPYFLRIIGNLLPSLMDPSNQSAPRTCLPPEKSGAEVGAWPQNLTKDVGKSFPIYLRGSCMARSHSPKMSFHTQSVGFKNNFGAFWTGSWVVPWQFAFQQTVASRWCCHDRHSIWVIKSEQISS